MAEVVLFHHAQGLTPGVTAFADRLREGGHTVHTPDLFEGRTFATLEEGLAHVEGIGFEQMGDRGVELGQGYPEGVVYAGMSMGVMAAQKLTQTRSGARGAVLLEACVPPAYFGTWPDGVPVQVHGMDADPFFAGEGDLDAARELVGTVPGSEVFVYPGHAHLFTDATLASYDEEATGLVVRRVLEFLDGC